MTTTGMNLSPTRVAARENEVVRKRTKLPPAPGYNRR